MVGAVAALALASGLFHPATDSSRYRAVVIYSSKTGTGAGAVLQDATVTSFLTLTQRDTVGGSIAEFRIDSLHVAPGKTVPAKYLVSPDLAKGLRYRSVIIKGIPTGGFQLSAPNDPASLLSSALSNLYPGFKATVKAGDSWADTTKVSSGVVHNTTISGWKIVSITGGEVVVDVTTSGSYSTTGRNAKGVEQEITGTMTGKRHLSGPLSGPMTSATITSDQPLKSITGTAAPISSTVKTTVTITRLP